MDKDYIIFQENGLCGAKNQRGEIIIQPQYMEMQPFSCGLSLVRNHQYQYAYINTLNRQIIPFGKYSWCDPQFTCGYARVMEYHYLEEKNQWGIIDTLGNIIVQLKYDKIWAIKEEYLFSLKAFLGDKEERINLHQLSNKVFFDGLTYICTYSVEAFKELVHCEKLYVKAQPNTRQLYFTYGANIGFVSLKGMPKEPVISIVANSNGKIFPLLMEKSDIGKATLSPAKRNSDLRHLQPLKDNYLCDSDLFGISHSFAEWAKSKKMWIAERERFPIRNPGKPALLTVRH